MRTRPKLQGQSARFESLESRKLLSVALGVNLLLNGDAESDSGAADDSTVAIPSDWHNGVPSFTVVQYGSPGGFPSNDDPGAGAGGGNFFAGGPADNGASNANELLYQDVDVSSFASAIDAGHIKMDLSGLLGGSGSQNDHMTLQGTFLDASGSKELGHTATKTVTAADRGNVTEFREVEIPVNVPAKTRFIRVSLEAIKTDGGYNDAYADNLSLTLGSTVGTISGKVVNDVNGNGKTDSGETGIKGITLFLDTNKNGKLDKGESSAKTNSSGNYKFANVPEGNVVVREVIPAGLRATTLLAPTVEVSGGLTTTRNFALSATVVVGGEVFFDTDRNGKIDSHDGTDDDVTAYLDFNNNGRQDSFELTTTPDSNGNYRFTLPFGTYVIREVVNPINKQALPSTPFVVTLQPGQTSLANNFLNKQIIAPPP